MRQLKKLFDPIKIGDVEIKNRISMSPLGVGFCEQDGSVTDRLIDFYVERAQGGVGLIGIVCCYNDFGYSMTHRVALEGDRFLPGIRRLTDALHAHGAKVFAQLMHQGASAHSMMLGHQAISASAVRSGLTGEVPRKLTIPEIKETIEHLAEGAWRAKEGGFDGVEIVAQGGYLINQFLSPLTNKRRDEYGGNMERRMRFPIELIQCIREKVGSGFPISCRICGDSYMPGGNRQKEIQTICQGMEKAGLNVINQAAGWHQCPIPLITMGVPRATFKYLSRGIKEVVSIPVITGHRINDPILADQILQEGSADMVGMGRPLLADPELPCKAEKGRFSEIRTCIACNQGCFDTLFAGREFTCAVNPAVGREKEYRIVSAAKHKKIVVVGGGPGGMEAARVLALRGFEVVLYEKADRLGGQLNLAAIAPGREEFIHAVDYLANEVQRLGVRIELEKEADVATVVADKPDAVVVATGGVPVRPDIPGIDRGNVVYAWDVFNDSVEVGQNVVVVGGGAIGCEVALFLAKKGTITADTAVFLASTGAMDAESAVKLTYTGNKKLTVVEMLPKIGRDIGATNRWPVRQSLQIHNVGLITGARAQGITESGVICTKDGEEILVPADTVVIAVGTKTVPGLLEDLQDVVPELYGVGDCIEPRTALEAIHEAAKVAREI